MTEGREAALRRRAACADVLSEAEASGDHHLAVQARTLLEQADAAVDVLVEEQRRDARDFLGRRGLDPALLGSKPPTGGERLERFIRHGDLADLTAAIDSRDRAVVERIAEAAGS